MKGVASRNLRLSIFLFLGFLSISDAGEWGDPTGFLSHEKVEQTELARGVDWFFADGQWNDQALKIHTIRADLSQADIHLASLMGERFALPKAGQFFQRSTVSQLQADNKALAAINVAFFNIAATQTPSGIAMKNGILYRESDSTRPSVLISDDGRVTLAAANTEQHIDIEARRHPLVGVNCNYLSGSSIAVYLPPWVKSPGNNALFTQREETTEVVVEKREFVFADSQNDKSQLIGTIKEIRLNQPGVSIGKDEFVLTATKSAAPFFRHAAVGQRIKVEWKLTGLPDGLHTHQIREIVSSGPILIRDGETNDSQSSFWTDKHPRSALGIRADQRAIVLVLVDGRWNQSVGISLQDLTKLMLHLGAHNAINFDGGGSSALAAKVKGKNKVLNHPSSGGIERKVPTGLGIFLGTGE